MKSAKVTSEGVVLETVGDGVDPFASQDPEFTTATSHDIADMIFSDLRAEFKLTVPIDLETHFKEWLRLYECVTTERWAELTVSETEVLASHYWEEFSQGLMLEAVEES